MSAASVRTSVRRDNLPVFPIEAGNKGEPGSFSNARRIITFVPPRKDVFSFRRSAALKRDASDRDALDFVERNFILASVVELSGPGRLMRAHREFAGEFVRRTWVQAQGLLP